jgi:hypothetical protein
VSFAFPSCLGKVFFSLEGWGCWYVKLKIEIASIFEVDGLGSQPGVLFVFPHHVWVVQDLISERLSKVNDRKAVSWKEKKLSSRAPSRIGVSTSHPFTPGSSLEQASLRTSRGLSL